MSGYNPYYPDGWQSGEEGGTPITPAALNNMENGIGNALTPADVVNNLTSTATNKPLSAAQGKALNEAISQSTAKLSLSINATTWSAMYAALSILPTGYSASVYVTSAAMAFLTGGKYTSSNACVGTVGRSTNNYYFHVSMSAGNNIYAWRVDGLASASSTPTIGTLYRYQGTAVS